MQATPMTLALYQSQPEDDDNVAFTDDDHERLARRLTRVEDTLVDVSKGQAVSVALLEGAVAERKETAAHVRTIADTLAKHLGEHDALKDRESSGWVRMGLAVVDLFKAQPIATLAIIGLLFTLGGTGIAELVKNVLALIN